MFALRTSQLGRPCEPAHGTLRVVGHLLVRAIQIAATLMLVTFVTVETSRACSGKDEASASSTPTASQGIAKQQVIENQSIVMPSGIKSAVKSIACCASGHCGGHGYAGSCCAACSSGLNVVGWTVARVPTPHFVIATLHTPLSSPELEAQFRPPRTSL